MKLLPFLLLAVLILAGALRVAPMTSTSAATATSTTAQSPLNDPYANFTGYQSYLQSFYQPTVGGFRAYPISSPSGGDYYNYWTDDAGKMLTSFAALNDSTYASHAANFIMNNAINDSGYLYLPERITNYSSLTYLHVNTSQIASRNFNITYTPVVNPSFESENTSAVNGVPVNQPENWTSIIAGSGVANDENVQGLASDGTHYASTNATTEGSMVAYSQKMDVPNTIVVYAHNDPGIGENNGIVGNYTASYLASGSTASASASSSNQMVWSYVSYPTFAYNTIFPANSTFTVSTWISANQTLTGVTYGAQVNEVCNGYSTETSPWGGEVTSTINVGTTTTEYAISVPTGTSNFTFDSGCALHLIVYINPNTSHAYTFTINYDSRSYETNAAVPYLPTVSRLADASSTFGFSLKPFTTTDYFVALVTSDGSLVLTSGGVNTAMIPNLVSPVTVENFSITTEMKNWTSFNYNAATLTSSLNPNGLIDYLEFGVDANSTLGGYASWDDVYFILSVGEGDAPAPGPSEYLVGGYYYATNGIVGLSNVSDFRDQKVYEQSMSGGLITSPENTTTLGYAENPSIKQSFGSSPFISDFFVWDTDNNASGIMSRQIFPYSIAVGSVPYRLYVSGGNGSNINIDFWIGMDEYQNSYVWINATIAAGQDYIQPSMTMFNLGIDTIQLNDLNYGLGSFDTFFKYNPYWSWLQLSNGTLIKSTHGFNATSSDPNSTIYSTVSSYGYGNSTPTALLFTGFNTPEFADGLLIKPLQPSSVEEIDYVNNFFGHSLRIVMNENGKLIPPGGQSDTFSFQFTPLAKTLWTEPNATIYAFENAALKKPGVDISMPGTWGFDTYGLATWGLQSKNATVLNFAKELWNSQYQDVIQRLHVASTYNPTAQPVIYYRSLYSFATAGLLLFPGNSTVLNIAEQAALYGITDQLNSYGLPFGLEEDGWAVHLLGQLYPVANNIALESTYQSDIQQIIGHLQTNTTYVPQTLSSWNLTSSSALAYTPSVWNLNSTGQVNPIVRCNHPNIVFRCGEMTFGMMTASMTSGLTNYWSNPAFLTSFSLMQEMSNYQPGAGTAIDVRYPDNSGNSNTETQPVTVLGLLYWMEAMQSATGTFVAHLSGAGIQYIQTNTYDPTKYDSLTIGLSVPQGSTANITLNYLGKGGPPEAVFDNGVQLGNSQMSVNSNSGDITLTNVTSQIMFLWPAPAVGQRTTQISQTTKSISTGGPVSPPPFWVTYWWAMVIIVVVVAAAIVVVVRRRREKVELSTLQ